MKEYYFLLFDADETLFDFQYAEREAFKKALFQVGVAYEEDYHEVYTKLNEMMWKQLELGKLEREELLQTRFLRFFEAANIEGDAEAMRFHYQENLGAESRLLPGAKELCKELSMRFELYIVTNGVAETQTSRLEASGLLPYLNGVFISEKIGTPKPQKGFFDAVEQDIRGFSKERAIIIGDSLTSDIQGGINAGIDTCWYNPHGAENGTDIRPTYTVSSYEELKRLLGVTF